MNPLYLRELLKLFLKEDLGIAGDITTAPLHNKKGRAEIIAKEDFILCGVPFIEQLFSILDKETKIDWNFKEGELVKTGEALGEIKGSLKTILMGERTSLNILQRLSGIATETRKYVNVLSGSKIKLLDTRKTTPGIRLLEKHATRIGGAFNHRLGLYDAVMIKDNHIKAYGDVEKAVTEIFKVIPITTKIEVEIENWEQLSSLLNVIDLVDIVMLDNWNIEEVKEATETIKEKKGTIKIELSGNVTLESLKRIKDLPIDFVSTSKIITSAKWVDISLEVL